MLLRRLILIIAISFVALIFSGLSASAAERRISFDPDKCIKNDDGMIYFSIGRIVFRQPPENVIYALGGSIDDINSFPKVPVSSELEGCFDHPVQGVVFAFRRISDINPKSARSNTEANYVRVVLNSSTQVFGEDGVFPGICDLYKQPAQYVEGFIGCQKSKPCSNDPVYKTEEYNSPSGSSIYLYCPFPIKCSTIPEYCRGAYRLRDRLELYFNFSVALLPISSFIKADKDLRIRINNAEVKNYPWKE